MTHRGRATNRKSTAVAICEFQRKSDNLPGVPVGGILWIRSKDDNDTSDTSGDDIPAVDAGLGDYISWILRKKICAVNFRTLIFLSKLGSRGRARTYNPSVNSRLLYH